MNSVVHIISIALAVSIIKSDDRCGFMGIWKNELGSCVKFDFCLFGHLAGQYNSRVGEASDWYYLSGRYTTAGQNNKDTILGFSVAYNNEAHGNSNSTCSWTGIYYELTDTIYTTWLLTRFTPQAEKWKNTMVNQDVFRRSKTC